MSHNDMMMPGTSPSMPNTMEMKKRYYKTKINQMNSTPIDFKPVHFEQDDIPDFLKKFKKEQEDTQNIIPPEDRETYNFKASNLLKIMMMPLWKTEGSKKRNNG